MVDYTTVESVLIEVTEGTNVGKKFYFDGTEVSVGDEKVVNNKITISFPQETETEDSSITINLGVLKNLGLSFTIFHQTQDRSKGTNTSEVKTFGEIMNYIDKILFTGVSFARFKITLTTKYRTTTAIYDLEDYSFKTDGGVFPAGSMNFKWVKNLV